MLAKILSAGLVQRNGLEAALWALRKPVMAARSASTLQCTSRLICLPVSSAKRRSTWFIQDALVGAEWTRRRGRLSSHALTSGALWVA